MPHPAISFVEVAYFTDDVPGMATFYRALLGREPVAESPDMAIFLVDETKIFIHKMYTPKVNDLPPENHIAMSVADVNATCSGLVARGMRLEVEPLDYYWGRSAYLRDPDGHLIELIQKGD